MGITKENAQRLKAYFSAEFLGGNNILHAYHTCDYDDWTCQCDTGEGMTIDRIHDVLDAFVQSKDNK